MPRSALGQGLYQELHFVLVVYEGGCSILVSTDLSLAAPDIIRLYGYRTKIESMFREMKQVLGAFGYRFWSKSMPKLNRLLRNKDARPLEAVTNEQDRRAHPENDPGDRGIRHVPVHCDGTPATRCLAVFRPNHGAVFPLFANALPYGGLRSQCCCLFAQIYFSPVCSKSACIHNAIIKSKQENADAERNSLVSSRWRTFY